MARQETSHQNPFSGLLDFVSEMNRMADRTHNLDSRPETEERSHANAWIPPMDVAAVGDRLVVHAELSGVDEQDIEVTYTAPNLTNGGRRRIEGEESGHFSYHTKEISWGRFRRSIALAQGVRSEDIEVEFSNGLLRITVHRYGRADGPSRLSVNGVQHGR